MGPRPELSVEAVRMEVCIRELDGVVHPWSNLYRTLTEPYEALTRVWNTEASKKESIGEVQKQPDKEG